MKFINGCGLECTHFKQFCGIMLLKESVDMENEHLNMVSLHEEDDDLPD